MAIKAVNLQGVSGKCFTAIISVSLGKEEINYTVRHGEDAMKRNVYDIEKSPWRERNEWIHCTFFFLKLLKQNTIDLFLLYQENPNLPFYRIQSSSNVQGGWHTNRLVDLPCT
jgi:hypothetical protein